MDHLKRVEEEFTRQADTFDAHAVKADDQVAARFQEAMGSAGSGTVLDVACGPGVVTAALAGKAQAVTAFDATPAMLEKARKRCAEAGLQNVQFKQGNAESLPFDSGAFDGFVTRVAIHHFPDPKRVLKEIFRVLRPGGVLFARTASSIGIEAQLVSTGPRRWRSPDGVERFLVDEPMLTAWAGHQGGELLDPLKTTIVHDQRSMTTWVLRKRSD